jgi:hypothetical protein
LRSQSLTTRVATHSKTKRQVDKDQYNTPQTERDISTKTQHYQIQSELENVTIIGTNHPNHQAQRLSRKDCHKQETSKKPAVPAQSPINSKLGQPNNKQVMKVNNTKVNLHQPIKPIVEYMTGRTYHADPSNHDTWGHSLESIDTSKILRVVLQNPNGLKPYQGNSDLSYSLRICESIGAGILSLPETNVNWSHYQSQKILRCNLKNIFQSSSFQTSHTPEQFHSLYQPGGTITIALNRWTSRILHKGEDPYGLGRWSYMIMRGRGTMKLAVITGYRVCETTASSAGVKTAFMQQHRALSDHFRTANTLTAPNPRRQFILDLQAWVENLIQTDHQIILALLVD